MTTTIKLTKGYSTIVDDIDADLALQKWHVIDTSQNPYAARKKRVGSKQKTDFLHWSILERKIGRALTKEEECDHRNNNTLDNTRDNLRVATKSQNARNRRGTNKSGYKGAVWNKSVGRWQSSIRLNKKLKYLGLFDTPEEAHKAYVKAAKQAYGEFFNPENKVV